MINNTSQKSHIAHVRSSDSEIQTLENHLLEVSHISKTLAAKINIPEAGQLIGILHDFGKYSAEFQTYIQSGTGLIDQDNEDYVDASALRGSIDHSTAGAQWLWQATSKIGKNGEGKLCGQILALCIASHHSGLIDCLKPDGTNEFQRRINKEDERTHLNECQQNADQQILDTAQQLVKPVIVAMFKQLQSLMLGEQSDTVKHFYFGFWTRFLFSC